MIYIFICKYDDNDDDDVYDEYINDDYDQYDVVRFLMMYDDWNFFFGNFGEAPV